MAEANSKIEMLQKLKASGFITFEEYETQMRELQQPQVMQPLPGLVQQPMMPLPGAELKPGQAMCVTHGKSRIMSCLMQVSPGVYTCMAGMECKGGGMPSAAGGGLAMAGVPMGGMMIPMGAMGGIGEAAPGTFVCAAHGKNRTLAHMMEISPGLYQCQPGLECKVPKEMALCQKHGKKRLTNCLQLVMQTMEGNVYECIAEAQCQGGAGEPMVGSKRSADLATGGASKRLRPEDQIYSNEERAACAVHGKVRMLNCMNADGNGGWICKPDFACKTVMTGGGGADGTLSLTMGGGGPSSTVSCAIHGRNRSTHYMELGSDGQYRCKPDNQCKGAGGASTAGGGTGLNIAPVLFDPQGALSK